MCSYEMSLKLVEDASSKHNCKPMHAHVGLRPNFSSTSNLLFFHRSIILVDLCWFVRLTNISPCFFAQHGRIAMLAICGLIAPEFYRIPGDIFQDVSVLDAHNVMVSVPPPPTLFFRFQCNQGLGSFLDPLLSVVVHCVLFSLQSQCCFCFFSLPTLV